MPAPDFLGTQYGSGGLQFRHGDATDSTSNLTPAGYTAHSLSLAPQVVPGTALGLVNRDGWFNIDSAWNFAVPKPGEAILLGLAGTSGPDYIDRLRLRFVSDVTTGQPRFSFERESRSGSTLTRTMLESVALADVYTDGSEVAYLDPALWRDAPSTGTPNPGVHARVGFSTISTTPAAATRSCSPAWILPRRGSRS